MGHGRDRRIGARRHNRKSLGRRGDEIAVTRPHTNLGGNVQEKRRGGCSDRRVAELALRGGRDRAAELVCHQLHAVADTQHRPAQIEQPWVALRRTGVGHAFRSARKNDPNRLSCANLVGRGVRRPDFRVHRKLAKPASDQLRVLRPEIKNDDGLMAHGLLEQGPTLVDAKALERLDAIITVWTRRGPQDVVVRSPSPWCAGARRRPRRRPRHSRSFRREPSGRSS